MLYVEIERKIDWEGRGGQAIQLFSMTIFHDLRVTVCVCSEGSAVLHIRQSL